MIKIEITNLTSNQVTLSHKISIPSFSFSQPTKQRNQGGLYVKNITFMHGFVAQYSTILDRDRTRVCDLSYNLF